MISLDLAEIHPLTEASKQELERHRKPTAENRRWCRLQARTFQCAGSRLLAAAGVFNAMVRLNGRDQ
jgi:hypothetical protein